MLRIRRARAEDAAGILSAHSAAIRTTCLTHYGAETVAGWAARLTVASYADDLERRDAFVAEADGGRIVGFAVLDADEGELRALYVHPDAGGQGVGRRLLDALEAIARLRAVGELRLDASLNAVAFYAAAGWRRLYESRRTFLGGPDIACLAMAKTLAPLRLAVREEIPDDTAAIRGVETAAFARPAEAWLVDRLRDAESLAMSLVATLDDAVVGHAALSPVTIAGVGSPVLGLGPVAVRPELQRCALGARLVEESLARARERGVAAVVVLGHPHYYPRFGFVPASRFALRYATPVPDDAFMVAELVPGALAAATGLVRYHAAFDAVAAS